MTDKCPIVNAVCNVAHAICDTLTGSGDDD